MFQTNKEIRINLVWNLENWDFREQDANQSQL